MRDKSDLDLQHLRSFLAVAETLHFTSAAHRRGISQSTISQHINRLEETLDVSLLSRSTKVVELTQAGQTLISLARDILQQQDHIFELSTTLDRPQHIRIGLTEDLVLSEFPRVLRNFRKQNPKTKISQTIALSHQLRNELNKGEIDLMFGMQGPNEGHGVPLWQEKLSWYAYPEEKLVDEASIPLVVFPEGSVTRRIAIETLNRYKLRWHIAFCSESLGALLAAVKAGYGCTLQPAFLKRSVLTEPVFLPALPEAPSVNFVAFNDRPEFSAPEQQLIDGAKAIFPA
ncbi:LysR family transcriptional regulator [Acetobacter estunensis]|uniref:LysR family transcriptional regulator n=1 Tax=Acetobacter estunensis TaxID=104097 RepID=UPI001C2CDD2C|nr:LysR family transcriptional regulator [Acetobacter estunensis]MBV1837865.1 LysR family transcriptional regulator [Acetobacter estunensis]